MKQTILIFIFLTSMNSLFAQRVYPLVPGIAIDSVMEPRPGVTKLAMDPVSGHLFYSVANGEIYEVFMPSSGTATDTLRYTSVQHGITFLQGLYFRDSTLYLCGNVWSATTGVGKIVKGVLQSNGTRNWINIVTTDPYPTASSSGDHGFAGVSLDPAGNYIYVSSGARTHLGEIRTNNGAWPGCREVPMTSRIFRFPANTAGLTLANDSSFIDNSGYVFAWGTRNAYDIAWDGNDTLFAIDNSGERDDPEELNWLRQGRHYGYPWNMGGNDNPLRNSPYDVNLDPLVNHLSSGYINGWFADDPTFPAVPPGITFTEGVRNYGTAADYYRDPVTGNVMDASDESTYIPSFTSHRSPLGLVFDKDSMLASPFRGDGFVLSFMPGGDSLGFSPISPWGGPCPFVDSSRELVQLHLTYNSGIDNYTMTTSNVVSGFYLPVDAELTDSVMYVIENGGDLWKITFPAYTGIAAVQKSFGIKIYPNPFNDVTTIEFNNPAKSNCEMMLYNMYGQAVRSITNINSDTIKLERETLSSGLYFISIKSGNEVSAAGKLIVE